MGAFIQAIQWRGSHGRYEISDLDLGARPTLENLTRFLKEDDVVAQAFGVAVAAAGVAQASDELLIIEEEDVGRLTHLGLESLASLREAFEASAPMVATLIAQWRQDSDSALTRQELLWALTYVLAADGDKPLKQIRALVAEERWWQRATESHKDRFLERIIPELVRARQLEPRPE